MPWRRKTNSLEVLQSAFSFELFCKRSPALGADVIFLAFNFLLQTIFGFTAQVTNNHRIPLHLLAFAGSDLSQYSRPGVTIGVRISFPKEKVSDKRPTRQVKFIGEKCKVRHSENAYGALGFLSRVRAITSEIHYWAHVRPEGCTAGGPRPTCADQIFIETGYFPAVACAPETVGVRRM
jgi:hypothetical protein